MKNKEPNILKLSIVLFIIAGFSAFLLSLVYSVTQPRIIKNEIKKEQENIKIIMPNVKSFEKKDNYYIIYSDTEKKNVIGYIFKTSAKGYGGDVVCNIGININGEVTGVVVVSHSETPGLGSKIEEVKKGEKEPYYLRQFKGKTKDKINFENIEAITGATISSRAVLNCVKEAFKIFVAIKK